jgi:hypothetical protein
MRSAIPPYELFLARIVSRIEPRLFRQNGLSTALLHLVDQEDDEQLDDTFHRCSTFSRAE